MIFLSVFSLFYSTCTGKSWSCTQNQCPKSCSVYGDSHYTTFDSKRYQFHGACDYTLVQDGCGDQLGSFRIQAENIPCGSTGVTCTKSITITINDTQISMVRGNKPTISSVPGSLQSVQQADFTLEKSGLFQILRTRIGMTIVWDFGTRIYITLDTSYRGECRHVTLIQQLKLSLRGSMATVDFHHFNRSQMLIVIVSYLHPCKSCLLDMDRIFQ
jgi:hypothetical protein